MIDQRLFQTQAHVAPGGREGRRRRREGGREGERETSQIRVKWLVNGVVWLD